MHFKQTHQVAKQWVGGFSRWLLGVAVGITFGALVGAVYGVLWGGLYGVLYGEMGRVLTCGLAFAAGAAVGGGLAGALFGLEVWAPGDEPLPLSEDGRGKSLESPARDPSRVPRASRQNDWPSPEPVFRRARLFPN
jgi:hypothetical protein